MEQTSFLPEETNSIQSRAIAYALLDSEDREPTPERIAALEALPWVERLGVLDKIKRFHQTWWSWYHDEIEMRQ